MAEMKHSGGIVEAVLELGFDTVKYFEGCVTTVATGFTVSPPAKRFSLSNRGAESAVYVRINPEEGETALPVVSFVPGDNIKIGPGCNFSMDFDSVREISMITASGTVLVEGLLGWKGTGSC
jgi:hypothetical protein